MKIKEGGAISNLNYNGSKSKIEEAKVWNEGNKRSIYFSINDDCLSYLTIEEAMDLRDELNKAIKEASGV